MGLNTPLANEVTVKRQIFYRKLCLSLVMYGCLALLHCDCC